MQNLKYYVLGKKDSPLLKEYLDKYYNKLKEDLKKINSHSFILKAKGVGNGLLDSLLSHKGNREFILNPDISSLINSISMQINSPSFILKGKGLGDGLIKSISKLNKEINTFILEGINSKNLIKNKGKLIAGTSIRLSLNDNNPYNQFEAHPDHKYNGGVLGWGEKSELEWLDIYSKSFNVLKDLDEGIYDELNQIIKKIVPLGTSKGVHNSASYKECIGHLYMGFTIDSTSPEINNLEAIIHESSHNKLNLIMQFDPIVLNTREEKYYSAIRPDARHIHGVFLGYHAFAPTMYMLMNAYKNGLLGEDIHWLEKIVLYYIKTKFLQKVIKKYAKLTKLGKEISEEIDYVISKMDILFKEINPSKNIITRAKCNQIEHFNLVNQKYSYLQY